jgi:hypothetical protein
MGCSLLAGLTVRNDAMILPTLSFFLNSDASRLCMSVVFVLKTENREDRPAAA